jgi:hypothetical protein
MKDFRNATAEEMVEAYQRVKSVGLTRVRLGNVGVFARTDRDQQYLMSHVDRDAI